MPSVEDRLRYWRDRAIRAEADRAAAHARLADLIRKITEASAPENLWAAMDNVRDMDTGLTEYAAAASRAIRAALQLDKEAGE